MDLLLAACGAAAVARAKLYAWKEKLKRPSNEQLELERRVSFRRVIAVAADSIASLRCEADLGDPTAGNSDMHLTHLLSSFFTSSMLVFWKAVLPSVETIVE